MKELLNLNRAEIADEYYEFADRVANSRPKPIREYDQIYMFSTDMILQALLVEKIIANKKILFLGDGDGMSLLLLFLMENHKITAAEEIRVLDFDERIVNNYKQFFDKSCLTAKVHLNANMYNVLNPIEDDKLKKYFDFFYINPPYGSKNQGNSCIAWLYRCMEYCKEQSSGCIIMPYDRHFDWSIYNMKKIQNFLLQNGYIIRNMIPNIHRYHLDDNPTLRSSALIVDRMEDSGRLYEEFPDELVCNLYGSPRKYPQYIYDNGTLVGEKDFSWKYGKEKF